MYIKSWKFREVCLSTIPFIHMYPEQLYIIDVFIRHFISLWSKAFLSLQLEVDFTILLIVEQPCPLTGKAS